MPTSPIPISAVIICRNEESHIRTCIAALRDVVDEVIVVDSGSTDQTLIILREFGITAIHRDFDGYGAQKRFACSLAKNQWVLSIDADEVISDELRSELLRFQPGNDVAAYAIPRRFRFLGKTFRHGHGAVDHPIRLFDRTRAEFDEASVHESVRVSGSTSALVGEMIHDSYRSLEHYLIKFDRYTTLGAEELVKRGRYRNPVMAGLLVPLYFLKYYLVWGHILNGTEGFIWSALSSVHAFVKVCKAWALRKL